MIDLMESGIAWVLAVQQLGQWAALPMAFFSFLGSEQFFLLIPVIYWCMDAQLGLRVGIMLLFTGGINNLLKMVLQSPRPYWYSAAVEARAAEATFGAPSAHAQISVGVWGTIAAYYKKTWIWIAAIILIFLIGLSRLYLGVHFPHDVLLGWMFGGLILILYFYFWDAIEKWVRDLPLREQVFLSFGSSLVLVLIGVAIVGTMNGWSMPAAWQALASRAEGGPPDPFSLDGILAASGALFGLLAGAAVMQRKGGYSASGLVLKRVARFLIGMVVLLAIYFLLKAVFPPGPSLAAYFFRYLRYALIGFWVTGGAPWIFLRMKLANPATEPI